MNEEAKPDWLIENLGDETRQIMEASQRKTLPEGINLIQPFKKLSPAELFEAGRIQAAFERKKEIEESLFPYGYNPPLPILYID